MKPAALLLIVLGATAQAADVCAPAGAVLTGARAGVLEWRTFQGDAPGKRRCFGVEARNLGKSPLALEWPEVQIARASLAGSLLVGVCCFPSTIQVSDTLHYGSPPQTLAVRIFKEPPEGAAEREEGFPDLIEDEARERVIGIRGTLQAEGRPVRVDLTVRFSASKFATEYAYQFHIADRSPDPVAVEWDVLRRLGERLTPAVQKTANGTAWLFLTSAEPAEVESAIEVRTPSGAVAGRFRFDGFAPRSAAN